MKKNYRLLAALALPLAVLTASHATPIVLTFEGLGNEEVIENYYDGGLGGNGSGPGPNYGITFGADSESLIADADGGSGDFSNNPSGDTVAFFQSGPGDVMDIASGFTTGFSFYYAAAQAGSVTVYSGLDGGGTLLSTLTLSTTASPYTVWAPTGVTFSGTAESVVFSGAADFIAFDDITLGSATAGGGTPTVPDSGGLLLYVVAGLSLVGAGRLFAKQQAALS